MMNEMSKLKKTQSKYSIVRITTKSNTYPQIVYSKKKETKSNKIYKKGNQ